MAQKVYKLITNSYGFRAVLPSGLDSLTSTQNIRVKIRKPDGTILMKNLVNTDIVTGTKLIYVLIGNGDLDQEGIYDYEAADTTSGQDKKGALLQFSVTDEIS